MLDRFRDRFGTAGLVVAILALVLALTGGAYAASGGLTGKQKKEVKSIAKSFQGTGPAGAQGPAGSAGPKGDTGAKGDKGDAGAKGDTGNTGSAGTNGKNAEAIPFSGSKGPIGGVTCTEGGIEVKSASATTLVCNGAKGTNGTNGTTGFTEVLPSGKTETGSWGGYLIQEEPETWRGLFPISFNIPLAAPVPFANIQIVEVGQVAPPTCENPSHAGTASAENPEAAAGELCVYMTVNPEELSITVFQNGKSGIGSAGAGITGAVLAPGFSEVPARLYGSWAVTAP